jgi:ABC-type branched-subunit amino acid transport system ATPase component
VSELLEAHDLTVRFGGLVALDHVGLGVPAGSIVGLIGPNGAGKTTCFGALSGLVRPREGRVLIDGVDMTGASPQRRARAGMARTFQRAEVFSSLTVREHLVLAHRSRSTNVAGRLVRDVLGLGRRARPGEDEAVDGLLDLLGLTALQSARAGSLPLGTARLVELARALATGPRVLLLDEPSSGLDAGETAALTDCLRTIRADHGTAMLLVEHNVEMVLGLADRVTVLDFGQVIAEGDPQEIAASDVVQSAYLGTAP